MGACQCDRWYANTSLKMCGVEILQWAYLNGCGLPEIVCFKAAARGQLDLILWALGESNCCRRQERSSQSGCGGRLSARFEVGTR